MGHSAGVPFQITSFSPAVFKMKLHVQVVTFMDLLQAPSIMLMKSALDLPCVSP